MKKLSISKIFKASAVLTVAASILCSCGSVKTNGYEMLSYSENAKLYDSAQTESYVTYEMELPSSPVMDSESGSGFNYALKAEEESSSVSLKADTEADTQQLTDTAISGRKIIYSSSYNIQTKKFDESLQTLEVLMAKYGAYAEKANIYASDGMARSAHYTVRVPVQNYSLFTGEAGTLGVVTGSAQDNKDITENYYDTEARLESAKIREERVLEILKNSSKLDDVLALERELADIRYEIESFTGTLRKYDSLISYATVRISISEVKEYVAPKVEPVTFGERMSSAFKSGITEFKEGWQNFLVNITYSLIPLIIWIVVIIILVIVIKKIIKKTVKALKKYDDRNTQNTADKDENKENK